MASWRIIAARALTGEILDWDVPFSLASNPTRDLSGPSGLNGTIQPDYNFQVAADGLPIIEEWATALFLEVGEKIMWGGLVAGVAVAGSQLQVTCVGYAGYPAGIPYLGKPIRAGVKQPKETKKEQKLDKNHDGYIDGKPKTAANKLFSGSSTTMVTPVIDGWEVVRTIWSHVQNQPHGDLGVTVTQGKLGQNMGRDDGSDPYQLVRWDATDCGEEIDNIAEHLGFDYEEKHSWADRSSGKIDHHIVLAKNIGVKREDLAFVQGENITAVATPQSMGTSYCNDVFVIGKGTGAKTASVEVTAFDGKHVRRCQAVAHKGVGNVAQLRSKGRKVLTRHAERWVVPSIQVADHPNAPLGSWHLGDRILLNINVPWIGHSQAWHRIVADELSRDGTAVLTLTAPGM